MPLYVARDILGAVKVCAKSKDLVIHHVQLTLTAMVHPLVAAKVNVHITTVPKNLVSYSEFSGF